MTVVLLLRCPVNSLPPLGHSFFYEFSASLQESKRSRIVKIRVEHLKNLSSFRDVSGDIELQRFLKLLYDAEFFFGYFADPSDEFVYEDGFFFSLYLDAVEFAEYELSPGFFHNALSSADKCPIELIDSFESGGGIDRIAEGGVLDLLPYASDIPYNRHSFVDPHADTDLETVVFQELRIELLYFPLLCQGGSACEDGLVFLAAAKCSPECHNRISLVFVDKALFVHDDIGNFLEIDTQEVYQFLRFHIFRYTRESGDIGEETGNIHSLPIQFHFLEVIEDIDHEFFGQILGKGSFQGSFSGFLVDVFVSRHEDGRQHDDEHKLHGECEQSLEQVKIPYLGTEEHNESHKQEDYLKNAIFGVEREQDEQERECHQYDNLLPFLDFHDVFLIEHGIDHIRMDEYPVLDPAGSVEFIV